ncbi:Protein of unknown function [Bacillus cytotoxicus]|nr:Protein of unknown function [Bacillus cytotoxicus]
MRKEDFTVVAIAWFLITLAMYLLKFVLGVEL